MAVDIISLILSRVSLAPHIYLSISVPYYNCIKYKCTYTPSLAAVEVPLVFGITVQLIYKVKLLISSFMVCSLYLIEGPSKIRCRA